MIAAFRKVQEGEMFILENDVIVEIISDKRARTVVDGVVYDTKRNGNPVSGSLTKLGYNIKTKISRDEHPERFL